MSPHDLSVSAYRLVDYSTDCELLEDRDSFLGVTLGPMSVTDFAGCETQVWPQEADGSLPGAGKLPPHPSIFYTLAFIFLTSSLSP